MNLKKNYARLKFETFRLDKTEMGLRRNGQLKSMGTGAAVILALLVVLAIVISDQIADAARSDSAMAQESTAGSEEMLSQALLLRSLVEQFQLHE